MTPKTGVVEVISIWEANAKVIVAEIPTPTTAEKIGSETPIKVPRSTNRTIPALMSPTISPIPRMSPKDWVSSCENSTSIPSRSDSFRKSTTDSLVPASSSVPLLSKRIVARATVSSLETVVKFWEASIILWAISRSSLPDSISSFPSATPTRAASRSISAWASSAAEAFAIDSCLASSVNPASSKAFDCNNSAVAGKPRPTYCWIPELT